MKAKETAYKGYRFRSRLEARWAVFFDALGIEWHFEPEGFVLDDGTSYLPDFWLPIQSHVIPRRSAGHIIEIKGARSQADKKAIDKAQQLALASGHRVIILCGDPLEHIRIDCNRYDGSINERRVSLVYDENECRHWGFNALSYYKRQDGQENLFHELPRSRVIDAAVAARSARFEHNQVGAPSDWKRG